jgi:hypothetical protein
VECSCSGAEPQHPRASGRAANDVSPGARGRDVEGNNRSLHLIGDSANSWPAEEEVWEWRTIHSHVVQGACPGA